MHICRFFNEGESVDVILMIFNNANGFFFVCVEKTYQTQIIIPSGMFLHVIKCVWRENHFADDTDPFSIPTIKSFKQLTVIAKNS